MSKWLPDVLPTDRAADVATRALADRLTAVRRHLRRAVERPGEPEPVHQLRVWARRSDAALALYSDLLPPRHYKWFRRTLRRLRRAAGRARDCDVFAARVAGPAGRWPPDLAGERHKAQRQITRLYRRLDGAAKLKRRTRKLLTRLRDHTAGQSESFAERARSALRPVLADFLAAIPTDQSDESALHQFRIRGKALRYAMELVAPAFPPPLRDVLYPQVATLQEKLGRVNDLAGARDRLTGRLAQARDPADVTHLGLRLSQAEAELAEAREEFVRWWTPAVRDALREQFAELLGPSGNEPRWP